MRKTLGIVMPYIIVGLVIAINSITIEYQNLIISLIVGLLIGVWLLAIYKCVGTLDMLILTGLNCFVYTGGLIILFLLDFEVAQYISTTIGLLLPLNYICYYILLKNKPRLHMSYRYSYKNRKRRYF